MKEEEEEENVVKLENGSQNENSKIAIGIRPRPLICKPGHVNVGCKSEPLETKCYWNPGAWQDATRTSAFQPYKPPTLLTNLQRGNTQTEIPQLYVGKDITFFTLAGQGELTPDDICQASLDALDEKGLSGLMWAASYGQLGSARQLLEAGADKNCRGHQGQTPLHLAAAYGHHDLVKLLISHGADPNIYEEEGNTPLIYGAHGDHRHVCYELLSKGADVAHRNIHGISAYHAAILNNSLAAKAVIENYLVEKLVNTSTGILS
ncbi:ankyrin repeat family A protein 2-like [Leptopilina boulardi]|uniref:ankyrin repeat family A protein 2-like n=1 Tax=Leptopilina boulardi TaxID=63433 RepID=UPI0021F53DFA|nr:ankyrin repeat family A protein 2-like [Leptopilina boulardi]XP_051164764.1 ankyrin repeat family A protein 2-like [Leptopilina boulardi]